MPSIVFDYGQGFSLDVAPLGFVRYAQPVELQASRDGVDINPLQPFPFDLHGPRNVAQRIADTFRESGQRLAWTDMIRSAGRTFIIQLKGLEHSLERAVTEFLLWNLIGFIESLGPGPMRCFVVLDEPHKLSLDRGSPAEKLLREGRKFGLGLMLASQQPEDFSPVAFATTATKVVFQVGDERSTVSRQLHRKVKNAHSLSDIYEIVTKLPRGWAYVVTENIGHVVEILSLEERVARWNQ